MMELGTQQPRGTRRLIYVSDPSNTTSRLGDPTTEEDLRNVVRNYARGKIDTAVQEIFAECMTMFWRNDICPYDIRPHHQRMVPMMDAGTMPVEIYIDECHKQGMEFLAGFRMNDRHGHHPEYFKMLCEEKPEWVLREYKPSWRGAPQESHEYGCSLNYAVEGAREFLLSIIEAAVSRFDLDGVELNYTRLVECFPRDEAAGSSPIMTDFIRRVREILDAKDGRKLILGVRVPQQLAGCLAWGLDIPTWMRKGLIDFVAPGDFGFTDFNEKWENFTSIARETDCLVYPQTQPKIGIELNRTTVMSYAQYRAALTNIYAAGADGFSVQNHFFHWGLFNVGTEPDGKAPAYPPNVGGYPEPFDDMAKLTDPSALADAERHYTFLPLWGDRQDGRGMSYIYEKEEIRLNRSEEKPTGSFRFRVYEEMPKRKSEGCRLIIQAIGLNVTDQLVASINGIAADDIVWDCESDPATGTILISDPPFKRGDNELGLGLVACDTKDGEILVEQLDCYVT
tara:strand:+ start:4765 stop:6294 length:1530 start_codon:yes stop_codon:yes gene_type:complete